MDRIIPIEIRNKNRKRILFKITLTILVIFFVSYYLINMFSSNLKYDELKTCIVDKGTIEISVYAKGKLVPIKEIIITAPISSKILAVHKKAGDKIYAGDSLMELDIKSFKTDYDSKKEEHKLKANNLKLKKRAIKNKMKDLKMQLEIAEMQYQRGQIMLSNEKLLDSIGASTTDKVKQMELENKIKEMQLDQLRRNIESEELTSIEELRSLELNYKISQRNIELMQKTLGEAKILSPKTATLSWINDQIGTSISLGEEVARVSDLSNFKIEGEISDSYASKITLGNDVLIKIGKNKIYGIINNVTPSSKDGLIRFIVTLKEFELDQLRAGLKADLYLTHSIRDNVLRIDNGSYYTGPHEYNLWIIKDNKANKRKVTLGECSIDKVEVIEGLCEGEEVITSDMYHFENETSIKIKNK